MLTRLSPNRNVFVFGFMFVLELLRFWPCIRLFPDRAATFSYPCSLLTARNLLIFMFDFRCLFPLLSSIYIFIRYSVCVCVCLPSATFFSSLYVDIIRETNEKKNYIEHYNYSGLIISYKLCAHNACSTIRCWVFSCEPSNVCMLVAPCYLTTICSLWPGNKYNSMYKIEIVFSFFIVEFSGKLLDQLKIMGVLIFRSCVVNVEDSFSISTIWKF